MNKTKLISKRTFIFVQLILITFVSISTIAAQTSSVDLSFNAVVSKDKDQNNNSIQANFTLQPDGKILTYGNFQVVNGEVKNGIARLNPDGSLDNSFNCTTCNFVITSAVVQPDGKIIVAGRTSGSYSTAVIFRLNADGSYDGSFTSPFPAVVFPESNSADVRAVQSDSKILVILYRSFGNSYNYTLYRLNPNGTVDSSFSTIVVASGSGGNFGQNPGKISLLPSGKILTVTNSFANAPGSTPGNAIIKRYNTDGTADATFETAIFTINSGTNNGALINDFEFLPDGNLLVIGRFTAANGVSRSNIAKILPAGNVDLSFAPMNVFQTGEPATGVEIYSNGKFLVSTGIVSTFGGQTGTTNRFILYNADGTVDNTFTSPANLISIRKFVIDSSDSVFLYGSFTENGTTVNKFARLNSDGSVSSSFVVNYGIGGSVTTAALQADGKVLIGGDFTQVNNVSRNKIARLNTDGNVDQTFNPQIGTNYTVGKIAIQSDGKILLGGSFNINNVGNIGLIRLNSDGSLDTAFNPIVSNVLSIVQQPDGKILVGGSFTGINGQSRAGLVRLNSDGTIDAGFNAIFANGASIGNIILQSDGKILAGGFFSGVNGFNRSNLVRLNSDGSLDSTFNAGSILGVLAVEPYPNGKYLAVVGSTVVRLNNDGTTDSTFQSATLNGIVNAIAVQPDGTIIIGGNFSSNRLARLRADGTVDNTFLTVGANNTVRTIVRQNDGKLIVGGDFTMIANVTRLGIARLNIAPIRAKTTLFDFDGDGKADIAVYRPSNGVLYELLSRNNSFAFAQIGPFLSQNDRLAFADYDGDAKTDIAIFRESTTDDKAFFYIINSSTNAPRFVQFGTQGDLPMSGDWDGDGIDDLAVYRNAATAGGQSYFYYRPSSQSGVDFRAIAWGTRGDKPVRGDFDGDGKLDAAVFRPSNGVWYILQSSNGQVIQQPFGLPTDILTPADYDGDGKTNIAVFRPSTGFWYTSTNAAIGYGGVQFGAAGDVPVPADYDGDGKADVAVFRPSNGVWYLLRSTAGFTGIQFGAMEDKPIPNIYIR